MSDTTNLAGDKPLPRWRKQADDRAKLKAARKEAKRIRERGDKHKAWQKKRKLTNPAAAKELGVPLRTYGDWKGGQHAPRGFALKQLREKLKASTRRSNGGADLTPTGVGGPRSGTGALTPRWLE